MKLYNAIGPNPQVVRMFAAEKGLALDLVPVDLMAGENRRPPYTETVNKFGQLPALEASEGAILSEVVAICEYLEETQPEPPLIGATALERAETRMWVRRIDLNINEPLALAFKSLEGRRMFESRMELVSETAAADLYAIFNRNLGWLDGQMGENEWVCGNRFTLADITLYANLGLLPMIGRKPPEAAAWLPGFVERVKARPSAAA